MNLNQRPSKIWIYFPLYLLALWGIVTLTWRGLNPSAPQTTEISQVESASEGIEEESNLHCFTDDCKNLSGVFELWPDAEINAALNSIDSHCLEEVCAICGYDASLVESFSELEDEHCIEDLFSLANEFHIEQIKSLPKTAFFYNSGKQTLSRDQKRGLGMLMNAYKGTKENYGVVILGRASKGGNPKDNAKISEQRAKNIESEIHSIMGRGFATKYVYFGSKAPQLNKEVADHIGLQIEDYKNIRISGSKRRDYSMRLNQSVIVVLYELSENPFGL